MRTHIWALLPLFLGGCSFTRVNNHPTTYYSTNIENRRLERTREIPAAAVEPSVSPPRIQNTPPNVPVQEGKSVSQVEVNHRVILDWSQLKPELKPDPPKKSETPEEPDPPPEPLRSAPPLLLELLEPPLELDFELPEGWLNAVGRVVEAM